MGSMSPYGVGGVHRHTPEIEQNLAAAAGRPVTVSFTPTLAPMPRGILATCTAGAAGRRPAAVRAAWDGAYADEPFVHVLPEGRGRRPAASSAATPCTCRSCSTSGSAGSSCRRGRQPHQGHRRRGRAVRQPRAGPARDRRSADRRGRAVSGCRAPPEGFRASGVTAGLKTCGRPDVALVVNDGPDHHAAAVFTGNRVEAAPVTWSRQVVADGRVDAVVLNSGGANACTGRAGFHDTHRTAEHVGAALDVGAGDVVVCSTGLIGERLPMDLLLAGVDAAAAGSARRPRRRGAARS